MSVAITTRKGRVVGERVGPVDVFRGIPFAEAPKGALRFAPPIPRARWTGVRDATQRAPAGPHVPSAVGRVIGLTDDLQDEDCLHATVWTPSERQGLAPVMVWIHGGGFESGSAGNPIADGSAIAGRGVVVVALQYRTGIAGFVPLDGAAENRGILDLVLGLRWVEEEIEAFGGDPGNVTLFGSSAGGVCVAALLAVAEARSCFHRAIVQSGTAECFVGKDQALATSREIAQALEESDGVALRRRLEGLAVGELLAVQAAVSQRVEARTGGLAFAPWLPGAPFGGAPIAAVARGHARGIPLLVGSNEDEMKLLALRSFPFAPRTMRDRELRDAVTALLGGRVGLADRALTLYRSFPHLSSARTNDVHAAIATDLHFRVPALRLADAHSRHEPRTFGYLLSWPSPQLGPIVGTPHAIEIPLVFGTYRVPPLPFFLGSRPTLAAMSRRLQDVWLAFARSGHPATEETGHWPEHAEDARTTMVLGEPFRVEPDFMREAMGFWREAFAELRPVVGFDVSGPSRPGSRISALLPAHVES